MTEPARRAVWYANDEAKKLRERYVTPDHLFLGILREEESSGRGIITQLGGDLAALRRSLLARRTGKRVFFASAREMTPDGKRVFDIAAAEADARESGSIFLGYLLIGILEEGNSESARLLSGAGLNGQFLRNAMATIQEDPSL